MSGRFDHRGQWAAAPSSGGQGYMPVAVIKAKRMFDIVGAMALLSVLAIVFIPVALDQA
ncbi:MAG: hypothetical protein R3D29_07710 [Nitratireductor sp.]